MSITKKIQEVLEYIDENVKTQPSLEELSEVCGLSPSYFNRLFKAYVGITPLQFLHATTIAHAKEVLKSSPSILDSSLELGLSSSSRLHDLFVNLEGITPNEYKNLWRGVKDRFMDLLLHLLGKLLLHKVHEGSWHWLFLMMGIMST